MSDVRFEDVPAAQADAEIDPHWRKLHRAQLLPVAYMPPTMGGRHGYSMRFVALVLIAVFGLATFCGVCLTYGPGH